METIQSYKMINAEMSKAIATLKTEVTRLQDENKKITADSLRAQNKIISLEKQITDSQRIQFEHVQALTNELQSFVAKMNTIALINNKRNQIGEKSLSNLCANNIKVSRRMSRSFELPVERRQSASRNDQEEIGLHTIAEEDDEKDTTRNITHSTVASPCQSTIENLNSIDNSLLNPNTSTTVQSAAISNANSHSVASNSIDSNKENQSSQSSEEQIEYFGAFSPLTNVVFVTNRRKKPDVISHSNENGGMSGVISSTPYKRIASETNTEQSISTFLSESDACETGTEASCVPNTRSKRVRNTTKSFSTLTNDSAIIGTNTQEVEIVPLKRTKNTGKIFSNLSNGATVFKAETMPIELSNARPKRKASQVTTFVEPKLHTKLRRPLSMEKKVSAKPKRN